MNKKRIYQTPLTERKVVELEGGFCGSIMETPSDVKTTQHDTGKDIDFGAEDNGGFTVSSWE